MKWSKNGHKRQNILACFTFPQSIHLEDHNETKMKEIDGVSAKIQGVAICCQNSAMPLPVMSTKI